MTCVLQSIHIYPLKSCAALSFDQAQVEPRGLVNDRRWMVVDENDASLTGRECATLTLLRARPGDDGALCLDAPGMPPLIVRAPGSAGERVPTVVWGSPVSPVLANAQAHVWLSAFLKRPVRLLYMDEACIRVLNNKYSRPGDVVSLADSFPVLLLSQEAVDLLNTKLATPVPVLQLRPNLVIVGGGAHVEDGWRYIRIGEVELELAKPRTLCVFANVDPERGARDAGGEPLRTLAGYRRTEHGLTFGQKFIPRRLGAVRVGDPIEVIA